MDFETLLASIKHSISELYDNDKTLIYDDPKHEHNKETEYHVSERGIVFRFGVYLEQYLRGKSILPKEYSIDVEYNRNIYATKSLPEQDKSIYPDLIIHKRRKHDANLVVFEFKTWWNTNTDYDIDKLKCLTDKKFKFGYDYGLSIKLNKTDVEYTLVSNGQIVKEKEKLFEHAQA